MNVTRVEYLETAVFLVHIVRRINQDPLSNTVNLFPHAVCSLINCFWNYFSIQIYTVKFYSIAFVPSHHNFECYSRQGCPPIFHHVYVPLLLLFHDMCLLYISIYHSPIPRS